MTSIDQRQFDRLPSKKRGSLVITPEYEHAQRFPCLIIDASPVGFKLRVGVRLRRGQLVEVIANDDPFTAVPCTVIWVGDPGSKQQGVVGLRVPGTMQSD